MCGLLALNSLSNTLQNIARGHYKILNPQYLVDLEISCLFKDMPDDSPAIALKKIDFSTLYTTIPHSKLKDKLRELVQLCFIKKNGQRRYKYLVLGKDRSYFVKHQSDSTKKLSETDIFNMLEFLIDNIFVMFGGRVFQQTVGITYWYQLCSSRRLVPLFV